MATQINPMDWPKPLALEQSKSTVYDRIWNSSCSASSLSCGAAVARPTSTSERSSYLHSAQLKHNLEESRKAFLNFCNTDAQTCQATQKEIANIPIRDQRKIVTKKISFKIKKTSSIYRRNSATSSKLNTNVAHLASKFNNMLSEHKSILQEPKIARLVRRVNSQKCEERLKYVVRKPSVKLKPTKFEEKKNNLLSKPVNRKVSVKKSPLKQHYSEAGQMCVRAKISYLETPQILKKSDQNIKLNISENRPPSTTDSSTSKSPTIGTVKAAIEIFEKQNTSSKNNDENVKEEPKYVPKPKVPAKNFSPETKDLLLKNAEKKTKILEKLTTEQGKNAQLNMSANAGDRNEKTESFDLEVQIVNIPLTPPRKCDSNYEMVKKITPPKQPGRSLNNEKPPVPDMKPNTSFLWRKTIPNGSSYETLNNIISQTQLPEDDYIIPQIQSSDWEDLYDKVDPNTCLIKSSSSEEEITANLISPAIPPRPTSLNAQSNTSSNKAIRKCKMPLPEPEDKVYDDRIEKTKIYEEKIYEDITNQNDGHDYEYCKTPVNYEGLNLKSDDGYEYFAAPTNNNKYETPPLPKRPVSQYLPKRQEEPLPPRPPSRESYCTVQNGEEVSNCYESIYTIGTSKHLDETEGNYESIYACRMNIKNWGNTSNRDSIVSSDQQSNSLYGRSVTNWAEEVFNMYSGKATSDRSASDKSDDWVDLSDSEEQKSNADVVVIKEKQKLSKKSSGWSQQLREQWNKSPRKFAHDHGTDSDPDHHYETLNIDQIAPQDDDFDSFDSDSESERSFTKINRADSGVDITNSRLPEPPPNQTYVLTRLAASAGKHMKRLRRNWSLTKNDITKSLSRMTKKKSRTDLTTLEPKDDKSPVLPARLSLDSNSISSDVNLRQTNQTQSNTQYQNVQFPCENSPESPNEKSKSLTRKGFLNKFRRSMSMSTESANELTQNLNKPKSTFYLTETIDVDGCNENLEKNKENVSPKTSKSVVVRPQNPPPPAPLNFVSSLDVRNRETKRSTSWYAECGLFKNAENMPKRPNSFWYAEVGLYQTNHSTPSTSSAENSGSNTTTNMTIQNLDTINHDNSEEYYNLKNENYYNKSISSFSSETKLDMSSGHFSNDMQLRLQDEPLYQFYDAAVLASICGEGSSDSDGYEEVGHKKLSTGSNRPSAMELVAPKKDFPHIRTLWSEIPEVIQSAVLSTLSSHQKKLQEAKFEMLTSEASYLNSLNVLIDHFIKNLKDCDFLKSEEHEVLFGKVHSVKSSSEKLLQDLEICWQENILLHGICDIVKTHAEENFSAYVTYCENQILIEGALKNIRERNGFNEYLKQLESSTACQSLTLYSFLMLPMQRITRWPLLIDAVLKRLSPQDDEYISCQYALATVNKVVVQCNDGARNMERKVEMKKLESQIQFGRSTTKIQLAKDSRWLVRSGPLIQMLSRGDDNKLTFGKRFSKIPLFLFLFNDMLLVTKCRSEDNYQVTHHCSRSMIEVNSDATLTVPLKDTQGRYLIFLTILENHENKTVEMLLSCSSESDKERWLEALLPPKSENPDETLYECWDCPQYTAIHNYVASQPDELALCRGDTINVTRKMIDGWFFGERIRDGETGWFPANYTLEVANPHVRARNLKQRYRLLAFSENYLKTK